MVLADSYYREDSHGALTWYSPLDVDIQRDSQGRIAQAILRSDGQPVQYGGMTKMSKSKNNGIDPQLMIDKYGADTVRLFMMFAAPPEATLEWSDSGVEGAQRFLRRMYRLVYDFSQHPQVSDQSQQWAQLTTAQADIRRAVHRTITKVSDDFGRRQQFNTAIAAIMELLNTVQKAPLEQPLDRAIMQEALDAMVLMLAPITPHLSEVLWQQLGHHTDIIHAPWPQPDEQALVAASMTVVVQVNGKLRGKVVVAADADQSVVEALAMADENVCRHLDGLTIHKQIYLPGKLYNIVAN
jgi:leucyl-tRNA synthetase